MPSLLEKGVRPISRSLNRVGMALLLVMMLFVSADVALRYVLNRPIKGTLELTEFMLVAVIFLGLAYTQAGEGHVGVTLVVDRLPRRAQPAIDSVTSFLALGVFGLIVWQSFQHAMTAWQQGATSDTLLIPMGPFMMLVPLGAGVLCLELLLKLGRCLAQLTRR